MKSVNKVEDDDQLQLLFSQRRRKPSSPKTFPCLMLYQNAEPKCRNQVNMLKDTQCKVPSTKLSRTMPPTVLFSSYPLA